MYREDDIGFSVLVNILGLTGREERIRKGWCEGSAAFIDGGVWSSDRLLALRNCWSSGYVGEEVKEAQP